MHKNYIKHAIQTLKKGGIVVYPNDTVYSLAVDATNPKAVKDLYKLKGRGFNKPVHVIFPSTVWLKKLVKLNIQALRLMDKFMPGPITLVLPMIAKGKSWEILSAGTKTLGVRYPDHAVAQGLAAGFGKPITTTSANIAGGDNTYSIPEVKKQFKNVLSTSIVFLDGGKLKKTKPSTVVLVNGRVKILREGPISEKQIKQAIK